ncbi:hypothetical protein [Catelliglobosispora koreensis]|uniref:hypothetical protein n=1 Tax=Catelliglobosispora koreensis TaxID=129052 RepID=UPI000380E323|nr:hypothetical protein [Catelliglobosispora koreensis]
MKIPKWTVALVPVVLLTGVLGWLRFWPSSGTPVVYEVAGTGVMTIQYVVDTTTVTEEASLPWRKEVTMTIPSFLVRVSANGWRGDGPTACTAWVDGEKFVSGTRRTLPGSAHGIPLVDCTRPYPR